MGHMYVAHFSLSPSTSTVLGGYYYHYYCNQLAMQGYFHF